MFGRDNVINFHYGWCVSEYWSHGTCPQDTKTMLIFRHFRYQIDSYFLISQLSKGTSNCRQNGTKGRALLWLGFFCPCSWSGLFSSEHYSSIFGMDRTRTHFGLGFFLFPNSSWKTTPSVKKLDQKGQSKGQL